MHRFVDQGISPYSFTEYPMFVECPFCHRHAIIFQQKQIIVVERVNEIF